jgi:hypothetical protein
MHCEREHYLTSVVLMFSAHDLHDEMHNIWRCIAQNATRAFLAAKNLYSWPEGNGFVFYITCVWCNGFPFAQAMAMNCGLTCKRENEQISLGSLACGEKLLEQIRFPDWTSSRWSFRSRRSLSKYGFLDWNNARVALSLQFIGDPRWHQTDHCVNVSSCLGWRE